MAAYNRVQKVASAIQMRLSELLLHEVKDPRLTWVTITSVVLSRDLSNARVYYVLTGDAKGAVADVEKALIKATPFLKKRVGEEMSLRVVPSLRFIYDDTFDKASRIDQLLKDVD